MKTQCGREIAKSLLEKYNYDIVSAFNELKDDAKKNIGYIEEIITVNGQEIVNKVKSLLKQTNLIHLEILKSGRTILSIPITIGILSLYMFPFLTSLSLFLSVNSNYTIKVLKISN